MADDGQNIGDIAAQAKAALPEITVTDWIPEAQAAATGGGEDDEQQSREEDAAEVLRQMEHYFSEENLPHDAHLLGLFQEGDGTVSFNEVCGWKAMRKWARGNRQKAWVKEVMKQSDIIEIIGNNKHPRIRRKLPLQTKPTVVPKVKRDTKAYSVPADKPWLTKGMMKPTGFEEGTDGAAPTAEEAEQDSVDYPADESFTTRIETAVTRYCARRKMHQDTRKVFIKFLTFGGFRDGPNMFIGGLDNTADDELTAKEKAERNQHQSVSEMVVKGLKAGQDGTPATWSVDFDDVVKGFLSSHFTSCFDWYNQQQVKTATNVLRNFNNYLLLHKVCPEYAGQIKAAIEVCDVADREFPKLAMVDQGLPGGFNVACSMVFGGHHADQLVQGDWAQDTDGGSWNSEQAWAVFRASIIAHGTTIQKTHLDLSLGDIKVFGTAKTIKAGFEIVAIEMPSKEALRAYECGHNEFPVVEPMGKLHCKQWKVPNAPPVDLPAGIKDPRSHPDPTREHTFLLEVSTLEHCYSGCKFVATVKTLPNGITWIDYHEATYASFYTWLANEVIREYKEPGPPKEWMKRQNERMQNGGVGMELALVPADADDDELD